VSWSLLAWVNRSEFSTESWQRRLQGSSLPVFHSSTPVIQSSGCLFHSWVPALGMLVLGMTLNCTHTEWCPGHDVKQHPHFHCQCQCFFIHSCIYLFIISYLATYLGTNGLSVLMCRKAVNQTNQTRNVIIKRPLSHRKVKNAVCWSWTYQICSLWWLPFLMDSLRLNFSKVRTLRRHLE